MVKKPFTTKWRAEPHNTYWNLVELCRKYLKNDVILEIKDKTLEDDDDIIQKIEEVKRLFLENDRMKHPLQILFSNNLFRKDLISLCAIRLY